MKDGARTITYAVIGEICSRSFSAPFSGVRVCGLYCSRSGGAKKITG